MASKSMTTRTPLFACLVCLLATTFFIVNVDIVKHIDDDTASDAAGSNRMRKHKRRKGASHVDVKTVRRKESASERKQKDAVGEPALEEKMSTDVKRKSKRKPKDATKSANTGNHYHNNAVFITHYHKTGYVLSRELMFLLHQVEHEVHRPDKKADKRGVQFEVSGIDENGERYAFDGIGNWQRSAFATRKHNERKCPFPVGRKKSQVVLPKTKGFTLREGTIYVQESPDLYCSDEEILEGLSLSHAGGTKIIHFVRNPYEMVLSNYFYHSQDPTPENWVHRDDPCEQLYDDGSSLSSHIVPALSKELNQPESYVTKRLDSIGTMCEELFENGTTFYEHLLELDKYDGLRLATAQMVAASGMSNGYWAGGDVLRMANNLIRFKRLQQASTPKSKIEVLTVTMGDFIKNMANGTNDFLNFILGEDDTTIPKEKLWEAALQQEEKYAKKKGRAHVTQTNEEDQRVKDELKERLRSDPDLSYILNVTEDLVNEALAA